MSQTESDPTQTHTSSPAAAADDEPLAHLHKMSTTAGLGSGEYVAVNGAAVAALLLGLASGLTLLEEVLLVIPLACIVVSIVAWRQINHSNGTQTGKGLIVVGLLCALGFGGFVVAREATAGIRTREDRAAIAARIDQLGARIKAGELDAAYAMFSQRFHEAVDAERFKERLGYVRESPVFGKLKDTRWNQLVAFDRDPATRQEFAVTKMKMIFDKSEIDVDAVLRKEAGQWFFENVPTFFPPEQGQRGR